MKSLSTISNLFLVSLLLISFTSCKDIAHTPGPDKTCFPYKGKPEQVITYKEMAMMLKQYKNTREGVLKNALGFEDTHTNWFQIDSLKKYIAYVEKLANDNKVEITGINLMSAAYPNTSKFGKEKNYQTLILIPTTYKGEFNRAAFDPLYSENGTPAYLDELLQPYFEEIENKISKKANDDSNNGNEDEDVDDLPSSGMNRSITTPPEG